MITNVLCSSLTILIEVDAKENGVVRIPRDFMKALEIESGDSLELAARYQFREGTWEMMLTPKHCIARQLSL